jgi:hypothetical protein
MSYKLTYIEKINKCREADLLVVDLLVVDLLAAVVPGLHPCLPEDSQR